MKIAEIQSTWFCLRISKNGFRICMWWMPVTVIHTPFALPTVRYSRNTGNYSTYWIWTILDLENQPLWTNCRMFQPAVLTITVFSSQHRPHQHTTLPNLLWMPALFRLACTTQNVSHRHFPFGLQVTRRFQIFSTTSLNLTRLIARCCIDLMDRPWLFKVIPQYNAIRGHERPYPFCFNLILDCPTIQLHITMVRGRYIRSRHQLLRIS